LNFYYHHIKLYFSLILQYSLVIKKIKTPVLFEQIKTTLGTHLPRTRALIEVSFENTENNYLTASEENNVNITKRQITYLLGHIRLQFLAISTVLLKFKITHWIIGIVTTAIFDYGGGIYPNYVEPNFISVDILIFKFLNICFIDHQVLQ
jgi:hypothetical protein